MGYHFVEDGIRVFGTGNLYDLDLIELVKAVQATDIFPVSRLNGGKNRGRLRFLPGNRKV